MNSKMRDTRCASFSIPLSKNGDLVEGNWAALPEEKPGPKEWPRR